MGEVVEAKLQQHLGIIKKTFGEPKEMEVAPGRYKWVCEPFFLVLYISNFVVSTYLSSSSMLQGVFQEFFKLVEFAMIIVSSICLLMYELHYLCFLHGLYFFFHMIYSVIIILF